MGQFDYVHWVVIPFLIIIARISDQTIGTLRLVYIGKGFKRIAPILGFFEVLIWIIVVSQILRQIDNYYYYVMYALGFALGNYIGLRIEEKLSIGQVVVRAFLKNDTERIKNELIKAGYGLSLVDAEGSRGKIRILFSIIHRRDSRTFLDIIKQTDPTVFYSIEDIRSTAEGIYPHKKKRSHLQKVFN